MYHLKDFNLLFLKLVEYCLYDTCSQSYILSKLIKNKEKHNNYKSILFISAKLPFATCDGFSQITSHLRASLVKGEMHPILKLSMFCSLCSREQLQCAVNQLKIW